MRAVAFWVCRHERRYGGLHLLVYSTRTSKLVYTTMRSVMRLAANVAIEQKWFIEFNSVQFALKLIPLCIYPTSARFDVTFSDRL